MYREVNITNDRKRLLKYWREEQNAPKWFKESNSTDECTDETFANFCNRHRIFEINEMALLYLEYMKPTEVNIHFSALRGKKINAVPDLIKIREMLFSEGVEFIFGWVAKSNRFLKRICKDVGLDFYGIEDRSLIVKGKPFARQLFSVCRSEYFIADSRKNLLLSMTAK